MEGCTRPRVLPKKKVTFAVDELMVDFKGPKFTYNWGQVKRIVRLRNMKWSKVVKKIGDDEVDALINFYWEMRYGHSRKQAGNRPTTMKAKRNWLISHSKQYCNGGNLGIYHPHMHESVREYFQWPTQNELKKHG